MLMKATSAATGFGSRSRCSLECGVRSRWSLTWRSRPSRPSGRCRLRRPRPLRLEGPPLYACRYALCGLSWNPASLIVRRTRRQAARGRAGILRTLADSLAQDRATSHNGVRYAFVRSKTPSHVALSGAPPPRCLQAESPARAPATLFGLPATLRAGTEAFCSLGAAF